MAKWLLLGTAIGVIAGLGAVLFARAIGLATHLFLGAIAGYTPPGPLGEGVPIIQDMSRPWLLPLVTALGGLLSGIIVFRFAPEAEGHGTDAAIAAYEAALAAAKSKAQGIANESREAIQADLAAKRSAVEADLTAKVTAAEARISATKAEALTHVDEIATETAQTVVTQLVGDVSADSVRAAVAKAKE